MEELDKKGLETNENELKENANKSEKDNLKIRVGTVGNFVLAAFIILVIGTGALTYYLIHSAKDDYDKQYNQIVSNIAEYENVIEDENNGDSQKSDTVANIIDSAISEAGGTTAVTTTDENTTTNDSFINFFV